MLRNVEFPHHEANLLLWIALAPIGAFVAVSTIVWMLASYAHLTPAARTANAQRGFGIFESENFDDAGKVYQRRFVRSFTWFILCASVSMVLAVIFPPA